MMSKLLLIPLLGVPDKLIRTDLKDPLIGDGHLEALKNRIVCYRYKRTDKLS